MTPDQIAAATAWVCQNQQIVNWVLAISLAHFGSSALSFILKKFQITGIDSGAFWTAVVNVIRAAALDAHTPAPTVLKQAAAIATVQGVPVQVAVAQAVAADPPPPLPPKGP